MKEIYLDKLGLIKESVEGTPATFEHTFTDDSVYKSLLGRRVGILDVPKDMDLSEMKVGMPLELLFDNPPVTIQFVVKRRGFKKRRIYFEECGGDNE